MGSPITPTTPVTPVTIDCHYLDQPRVAAAYLIRDGDRAAFIDNNTTHAVPRLLAALAAEGLTPSQVEYVIVTHVHLDHAGGTAALAAACPHATVLCHPRAERHLIDPSKLVQSARTVYGAENFARLYGEIEPIAAARVRAIGDGERVGFGDRALTFLHTRGHANHHACILDEQTGSIFTGDAFGLHYPRFQQHGPFAFPSTSPTDFDPVEARRSIERIVGTGATRVYPTHFGEVTALAETRAQLIDHLDQSEQVLEAAIASDLPDAELEGLCASRLRAVFDLAAARRGLTLSADDNAFLALDLDLNAQGVAFVAGRRRRERHGAR